MSATELAVDQEEGLDIDIGEFNDDVDDDLLDILSQEELRNKCIEMFHALLNIYQESPEVKKMHSLAVSINKSITSLQAKNPELVDTERFKEIIREIDGVRKGFELVINPPEATETESSTESTPATDTESTSAAATPEPESSTQVD